MKEPAKLPIRRTLICREAGQHGIYLARMMVESDSEAIGAIGNAVTASAAGVLRKLSQGDLDIRRNWGRAAALVDAMWLMPQQDQPAQHLTPSERSASLGRPVAAAFRASGPEGRQRAERHRAVPLPCDPKYRSADPALSHRFLGRVSRVDVNQVVLETCRAAASGSVAVQART